MKTTKPSQAIIITMIIFGLFSMFFTIPATAQAEESVNPFDLQIKWGHIPAVGGSPKINLDGYVEIFNGGSISLVKTIAFDSGSRDKITTIQTARIDWNSAIYNGSDGVLVKISPTSANQKVTIKTGGYSATFSLNELKNVNTLITIDSQGHKVEIKNTKNYPINKPVRLYMSWGKMSQLNPVKPNTKINWTGSLSVSNGKGQLIRADKYESNDTINSGNGNVSFNTITTSGKDGFVFEIPTNDTGVTVTIQIYSNASGFGGFKQTYTIENLKTIDYLQRTDNTGNGFMIRNNNK
jgi:hypothetical protein